MSLWLSFTFLWLLMMFNIVLCSCCYLHIFFIKCLGCLLIFLNQNIWFLLKYLSFMSSLNILGFNPLSDGWFAKKVGPPIFSVASSFCWLFLLLCRSFKIWHSPTGWFLLSLLLFLLMLLMLCYYVQIVIFCYYVQIIIFPIFSFESFAVSGFMI